MGGGGGLLFFVEFIYLLIGCIKKSISCNRKLIKNNLLLVIPACVLIFGIHYRTYLLTGYPIYPVALSIFNTLGFTARHHLKTVGINLNNSFSINSLFKRVFQFFFNPTELSHVVMCWTSNVVVIAFLIWLFNKKNKKELFNNKYIMALVFFFVFCCIYFMATMPQPDGNYFILPFTFISLFFIISVKSYNKYIYLFIPIIVVNFSLNFIIHSSWECGTHLITGHVIEENFESYNRDRFILEYHNLKDVDNYVLNNIYGEKVLSSTYEIKVIARLKCIVEQTNDLDDYLSSGYALKNYNNFNNYVKETGTSAFLLHKEDKTNFKKLVDKYIENNGYITKIETESFIFYDI